MVYSPDDSVTSLWAGTSHPDKDLESPSSTRLEALVPSRDSRARTRSPSPRACVESVSLPRLAASFPLRGCRGTGKQPTVETHSLNRAEHLHLPRAPHRGARGLGCPCPGRGPWPGWQPPLPRGSSAQKDQGREDGARSTPRLQTVQRWLAGALERQGLSRENTGRATARRTHPGLRAPDRAQ